MRYSTFCVLLVSVLPAAAQFRQLATDYTGSRVWFTTDLPDKGSDRQAYGRIWVADAQGRITVAAERPLSHSYRVLTRPQVSSDGSVLVFDANYYCHPGTTCRIADSMYGIITSRGQIESEIEGRVHMSRNGRWLLRESYLYFAPSSQIEIIDRQMIVRRQMPVTRSAYIDGGPRVTANGAALVYSNGLWLIRPDATHTYTAAFGLDPDVEPSPFFVTRTPCLAINDAGTLVVYENRAGLPEISAVRPGDETSQRVIASDAWGPGLSADGSRLLFVSPVNGIPQAWIVPISGGERRQITQDPGGIAEATLSGDGNIAWAVTLAGRIIRVEVASGNVKEIVPQTSVIESNPFGFPLRAAAGAIGRIRGRGLAPAHASSGLPLGTELAGVRVLADGQPLPLLSVGPEEIRFQVPWNLTGRHTLTLASTNSPFQDQPSHAVEFISAAPEFLYTPQGLPMIVHEDFSALVTQDDPARPGEILHLYMTGLGPVSPAAATGEAAPLTPLSFVTEQLFVFWQGSLPTNMPRPEVLFAGLAPGMVGVYQLDVRVPQIAPATLGISVQAGNSSGAAAEFRVSMF